MAKIFKTNNERSENRNTVMNKRQLFDVSSTQMPLVSTFMTNFPDEKQLLQMTRK